MLPLTHYLFVLNVRDIFIMIDNERLKQIQCCWENAVLGVICVA